MKALVDYLESVGASYFVQNEYGVLMTQRCLRAEAFNMADIFGLEEDGLLHAMEHLGLI